MLYTSETLTTLVHQLWQRANTLYGPLPTYNLHVQILPSNECPLSDIAPHRPVVAEITIQPDDLHATIVFNADKLSHPNFIHTPAHEVAHLVAVILYDDATHSPVWESIVKALGYLPLPTLKETPNGTHRPTSCNS